MWTKRVGVLAGLLAAAVVCAQDEARSPFGIGSCHTSNRSVDAQKGWVPQMRAIGVGWTRTPSSGWGGLEKPQETWNWSALDAQMDYLDAQGMKYGLMLSGRGFKDEKGLPVHGISDWENYVRELAKHVKGRNARYFEVWNEPPNGTAKDQTAADYARVVAAAYTAAHAVDPKNRVGLTAKSAHVNYLEHAIRKGAKNKFDWISFHPYETLNGIADNKGSEALFMSIVPTLRKMLRAQNPEKAEVPIIFTELGTDARKGADNQAQTLVKAYTMGIAQGVTQIQWFEARDGDSGPMGLMDAKGNPRPSYQAYGQMVKHFGPYPRYLGWVLLNGRDYGFVFQGAAGTVLCAWAPKGAPDPVDFGQAVRIVEPLTGNEVSAKNYALTVSPVFVLGVPQTLVAQAQANKDKPFWWGGDYTGAKSVSLAYGADGKVIAKGLHPTSGDDIGKAVVLYGGGARDGSVPGGTAFIVDPNFASYKTGPLEIAVTVRRRDPVKPASLTLEYECDKPDDPRGTDPFAKLPPQEIPAGEGWTTLKWRLTDAEFNGYWGFNFRYNNGGYLVQGVSVTKL